MSVASWMPKSEIASPFWRFSDKDTVFKGAPFSSSLISENWRLIGGFYVCELGLIFEFLLDQKSYIFGKLEFIENAILMQKILLKQIPIYQDIQFSRFYLLSRSMSD